MNVKKISALRELWKLSFGDADWLLDKFFSIAFAPERCHCIWEKDTPISVLYRFDCTLDGRKFAYLYAVATHPDHRGKGLARKLIADTHRLLQEQGYAGVILVPGSKSLFDFYQRIGYRKAATITEFTCTAARDSVPLLQIDARQYESARKAHLPPGGVVQTGVSLDFFGTYGAFYTGKDFLLACIEQDGILYAREFFGDPQLCGRILCALDLPRGEFRTPGTEKDFAMYYPLQEGCPAPQYFGFALD